MQKRKHGHFGPWRLRLLLGEGRTTAVHLAQRRHAALPCGRPYAGVAHPGVCIDVRKKKMLLREVGRWWRA